MDRGHAGPTEPVPGPEPPRRSGAGPPSARGRARDRGGADRDPGGGVHRPDAESRGGPVPLQRSRERREQAPRGRPLRHGRGPRRVPLRGGPGGPADDPHRPPPLPPAVPDDSEPGELGGRRETADGPRGVHPNRIAMPARAAPGDPPCAHVRLPERPGALHPELVLPRRLPGPREAPGPLDRGRGLRAPPARGDGPGTRRGAPAEGAGAPEGLTRAHAFARSLSYFPARISEMTSFGLFPSAVTPIETHVPTTSRTRPFTSFASITSVFMFAILIACAIVRFPIRVFPASPLPFSAPISFKIRADVGGVPTSIVYDFAFVSMTSFTGTFIPSKDFVRPLIACTISMLFMPMGPRAGPSGGPAVAFPPSTRTSSTSATYFSSSFCRTRTCVPGTVTGIRTMASKSSTVTSSFVTSIFITRAFSPLNGPAMSSTMSPSMIPLTTGFGVRYISISENGIPPRAPSPLE